MRGAFLFGIWVINKVDMERVGLFYSIFSADDVQLSFKYLVAMVKNIYVFEKYKMKEMGLNMIIYTDQFTLNVLKMILTQEKIDDSNVEYRIKPRNIDMKGMIWRLRGLVDNTFDISIIMEGDFEIEKYFRYIDVFRKYPLSPIFVYSARQIDKCDCAFATGYVMARPRLISGENKKRLENCITLIEHLDTVDYAVDERFINKFISKHFQYEKILVHIAKLGIKFAITDIAAEKNSILQRFKNAIIVDNNDIRASQKNSPFLTIESQTPSSKIRFSKEYRLNGVRYDTSVQNYHGRKINISTRGDDFCEDRLFAIIDPII